MIAGFPNLRIFELKFVNPLNSTIRKSESIVVNPQMHLHSLRISTEGMERDAVRASSSVVNGPCQREWFAACPAGCPLP